MRSKRMPRTSRWRTSKLHSMPILLLAASTIAAATSDVIAQQTTAGNGFSVASHIPSAAMDPVRPVAVIDRTDIELSGMNNVWDLLQSRLKFNSFGLHRPFVLGSGRMAILMNGRRISNSTADLDAIPITAVERIEVLSGSAAALHGGHAIGGAINIVLRRGHDGAEVQASLERPTEAGGDTEHGSVLWGGAIGDGHMTIGADVFRRQEIREADRDYSRARWTPGGSFADAAHVSVGGNTLFITDKPSSAVRALGDCEGSAYTGVLTAGPTDTVCGFAFAEIAWSWERRERESLFLNLDHPLDESSEVYVNARVTRSDVKSRAAPSVELELPIEPSADLEAQIRQIYPAFQDNALAAAHRFVGHGNRDSHADLEEYDLAFGLTGRLSGGTGYDAHLRYYRHDAVEAAGTFVSESAIQREIEDGRYDLADPQSTDPGHLAAIRRTGLRLTRDQVTDYKAARASFDGATFALDGGDVRWAAGAEVAYEEWRNIYDYRDIENRRYPADDVLGSAGNSAWGDRQRLSAFAELSLPLRHDWDVVLAGRRDDHDDVGATFSHEVASRFRLSEAFSIRGSWNEGSTPPSLYALHALETLDYPSICYTNTDRNERECTQVERATVGNPRLEPDETESLSLGAAASLGPVSLSADWFRIRLSDAPGRLSAQSIVDLEGNLPDGAGVEREGGRITRIVSPLFNNGKSDVSGVDWRARVDWESDWADWIVDARWLRTIRDETRVAGRIQPGDIPRDRIHASLRASRGDITATWSVYGVSGYEHVAKTGRYGAWTGHDISVRWRDAFGLTGTDLTAGMLNVRDRGPATAPGSYGVDADTTLDSIRGRTLFLTAKVSFDP